jgi:arabinogalactan endo-1,4-beta-galactosidase
MRRIAIAIAALLGAALAAPGGAAAAPVPLALDTALSGTATASTSADGAPASNAIDGSGTTLWCATDWTASLTVDLGQARPITGLGITVGPNMYADRVSVSYSGKSGSFKPVPGGQSMALATGEPVYLPSAPGVKARRVRLDVVSGDSQPPCIGELRVFARPQHPSVTLMGADLSFEQQEEAAGATYTDAGVAAPAMQILQNHGLNYVRLRLWVDPPPGYSNLASDLAMAQRIKAAGLGLYLDIHYSDFWADPQHQITPAAWQGQDLAQLSSTVEDYTRSVLQAFAAQGTPVDLVSIGNEIRNGFLWPVGQVDWTTDTGWDNLATLLKAGVAGAREGNPAGHQLRIMLHFDEGGNNADSRHFFDELTSRGVPFDVIGLSYYTFFHGPVANLRANLDDLATRYGKDIIIAELQYAWTLANGDSLGNFVWNPSQLEPGYPASPGGQLSLANDVLSILQEVPGHHGIGFFYWEPEWIPGVGWEPGAGTPNDNLTLFNFTGAALPSVGLFEDPVAVCQRAAPLTLPCQLPG